MERSMKVRLGSFALNYERQGDGEPLVLIPHLAADGACYAFQVPDYARHFTCILVDLRATGDSDDPGTEYSTETLADDVAALMQASGVARAHVAGMSLGAATAMWLAAKHPERVASLSLHSGWTATDPYCRAVVQGWQALARALGSVQETLIQAIFPWCLTPELYGGRPEYVASLAQFVRGRPPQSVDAFLRQSDAVLGHDVLGQLGRIRAPTLVTFGRRDAVTSTRFADPLLRGIAGARLHVFEDCAHAAMYENVPAFNDVTLSFLTGQAH
jgi:pimeloyl-ACP methyl ester carboxylesterase